METFDSEVDTWTRELVTGRGAVAEGPMGRTPAYGAPIVKHGAGVTVGLSRRRVRATAEGDTRRLAGKDTGYGASRVVVRRSPIDRPLHSPSTRPPPSRRHMPCRVLRRQRLASSPNPG